LVGIARRLAAAAASGSDAIGRAAQLARISDFH